MQKIRGFEKISAKKDNSDVQLPVRMTKYSVAYDFISPIEVIIPSKGEVTIHTGIKVYFQSDEAFFIAPRSSWGIKYGIQLKNSLAIFESDYYNNEQNEGEVIITLLNISDNEFSINKGDRFCQGYFQKILHIDDSSYTLEERKGGIGSTGKK